ncbi:hypothetical protein AUJ83_04455 [Candidatus Woesearchaeota archaeon CG1_02_33_12]|nr:MAG: hypothetical protein AUJ83_04455 [Candidatus Woesearchaeota archaeon CG1_02_33_12]PIN78333.1 MAG: hypothetical protein COV14_04010 [Candidatus Woesearchaeota archaeon CG10_big_fil_rev_8_21_14_0_10_33_12]PIU72845.1 MAG: hypothetical protein COS79_00810 [Candidatus Woesearchaeota archaeon CG06_land_8_20_14_3_00_33_13]
MEIIKLYKKLILVSAILLCTLKVSAYIDPGTGGMIIGSVWPFILAILAAIGGFFFRYFFKPIKKTFLKLWKLIKKSKKGN